MKWNFKMEVLISEWSFKAGFIVVIQLGLRRKDYSIFKGMVGNSFLF